MKFHKISLNKLKCCAVKEGIDEWQPRMSARNFVETVIRNGNCSELESEVNFGKFQDKKIDRSDVRKFVSSKDANTLEKVLFVLAWGGMNPRNARFALESYRNCWETIANDMLKTNLCRYEAYKQFHLLIKDGKLKGMGPAYFTKLIFFLEPKHNGYIMDQWTARSMNLLRKDNVRKIHLLSTGWRNGKKFRNFRVHPVKNDVCVYSNFCEDLECVAKFLCKEPEETEKLIFSKGGRLEKMGCWRRIVLEETS